MSRRRKRPRSGLRVPPKGASPQQHRATPPPAPPPSASPPPEPPGPAAGAMPAPEPDGAPAAAPTTAGSGSNGARPDGSKDATAPRAAAHGGPTKPLPPPPFVPPPVPPPPFVPPTTSAAGSDGGGTTPPPGALADDARASSSPVPDGPSGADRTSPPTPALDAGAGTAPAPVVEAGEPPPAHDPAVADPSFASNGATGHEAKAPARDGATPAAADGAVDHTTASDEGAAGDVGPGGVAASDVATREARDAGPGGVAASDGTIVDGDDSPVPVEDLGGGGAVMPAADHAAPAGRPPTEGEPVAASLAAPESDAAASSRDDAAPVDAAVPDDDSAAATVDATPAGTVTAGPGGAVSDGPAPGGDAAGEGEVSAGDTAGDAVGDGEASGVRDDVGGEGEISGVAPGSPAGGASGDTVELPAPGPASAPAPAPEPARAPAPARAAATNGEGTAGTADDAAWVAEFGSAVKAGASPAERPVRRARRPDAHLGVDLALRTLVVPPHGPDFWDEVGGRLADEPQLRLRPRAAVRPITQPPPVVENTFVYDAGSGRSKGGAWRRMVIVAAVVLLAGAAVVGLVRNRDDGRTETAGTTTATTAPGAATTAPAAGGGTPATTAPAAPPFDPAAPLTPSAVGRLPIPAVARDLGASGFALQVDQRTFDASGGTCYDARIAGAPDLLLRFRSPNPPAGVTDPNDGVLAAVSVEAGAGSPRLTDVGLGLGSPVDQVRAAYAGRYEELPHPFVAGGQVIRVGTQDGSGNGIAYFTDGLVVTAVAVGNWDVISVPDGCL